MSSNPNPYQKLADAVQTLEDTLGNGRELTITLVFADDGQGNPAVDYEVKERIIGKGQIELGTGLCCETIEEALTEIARAVEA